MIHNFKLAFWWIFPILLVYNLIPIDSSTNFTEIRHTLFIKHPGEEDLLEVVLTEVRNDKGFAIKFYMEVESVICLEEVCKVIPVTLFWNNIGEYQKYQIQKGAKLEKYEADLFESADYDKLHHILGNPNSPFKEVFIDEVMTIPSLKNDDIDAVSGETILELDDKDTVKGAALTCYTLWHWANGRIVDNIKNKTGDSATEQKLHQLLLDKNRSYFYIAIEELHKRKLCSKPIIDTIIEAVLEDDSLLRTTFEYFKNATSEQFFYANDRLFFEGKKAQKLGVINALKQVDFEIPSSLLDKICLALNKLDSYQEISLILDLMQSKNANSKLTIESALPMLKGDFIIARRVFWFLKTQKLNEVQTKQLNAFYTKNKNKF